ncbi:MAG TPA: Os1348 family NHLP clan protein [Vicinamibacterales bacterium]|jgi:hypothetical protein
MSHKTIQLIIGRLLTDEDFRRRFLHDPYETLATLVDQGFELTAGEIDALIQTDRATWTDTASRIDSRLQRASLRSDPGSAGQR